MYHLWSREHRVCAGLKLSRDPEAEALKSEKRSVAQRRLLLLLRGELDHQDVFGLGAERTIDDFQESIGVNFEERIILNGARRGALPESSFAASEIGELIGGMVGGSDIDISSGNPPLVRSLPPPSDPKIAALELVRQFISS